MSDIYVGNAAEAGQDTRGWIVGKFMPEGIRQTDNVEIKWGLHPAGESREDWVTGEQRTTVCMLVAGRFALQFQDEEAMLSKPGDYVMWGAGVDHTWRALDNSTVITVRWNS